MRRDLGLGPSPSRSPSPSHRAPRGPRAAARRASLVVLAAVVFAAPARARADELDAGVRPSCSEEAFVACAADDGGGACTVAGKPGTCANGACDRDGVYGEALQCITAAQCGTKEQLDPCAGKAVDDTCGTGGTCAVLRCGTLTDGGAPLACVYGAGGAGGTSATGDNPGTTGEVASAGDGSCAVGPLGVGAGGAHGRGLAGLGGAAAAALGVAVARAARRRSRRARDARPDGRNPA